MMLLSTSTLSPEAIRQRRCRRRQKQNLSLATLEVPWRIIELLLDQGRITESAALDPEQLGKAILAVAREKLERL